MRTCIYTQTAADTDVLEDRRLHEDVSRIDGSRYRVGNKDVVPVVQCYGDGRVLDDIVSRPFGYVPVQPE